MRTLPFLDAPLVSDFIGEAAMLRSSLEIDSLHSVTMVLNGVRGTFASSPKRPKREKEALSGAVQYGVRASSSTAERRRL